MNFSEALAHLKDGLRVARSGWNGAEMFIEIQVADDHSMMTLPYIFMFTSCKNFVPWLASQTDVLADDWEVVG